jgi:hypothetical protein
MAGTLTREQVLWRWRIFICTYVGYAGYCLVRKVYSIRKSSLHKQFGWYSGNWRISGWPIPSPVRWGRSSTATIGGDGVSDKSRHGEYTCSHRRE